MIAATPGRRRRLLALRSLLALVVLGLVPLAAPGVAHAAAAPALEVALTRAALVPAVPAPPAGGVQPADVVQVAGTVTNPTPLPAYGVRVQLWRSTALLRSRDVLDDAVGGSGVPLGRTVSTPTAVVDLGATPLLPGETRAFTLQATLEQMALSAGDGSYWVGANVRAQAAPGGTTATTEARTLVTMPGSTPTRLTTVVELSAAPRQVRPGLFTDDTLAEELEGRLGILLDAAADPGTARVVDPALVAEVTDMADGYRVVTADGSREGTGSAVARAWLADLEALPAASAHRSLFARPELASALTVGGTGLVDRLLAASATPDASRLLITLDDVDTATLAALARLDAPVLALGTGLTDVAVRVGRTPLVAATRPGLPLTGRALADTPLNRAAVLEAYARADGAQVRLVRTRADLDADRAASPVWAVRRSLADVLADARQPWTAPLVAADAAPVLGPEDVGRLDRLAEGLAAYEAVAPASGVTALVDGHLARAASEAWELNVAGRTAWLDAVDGHVGAGALARGVTLSALPRFTMSSAENEFPVTVTNALPDDVVVRVAASSDAPQRIRLESSDELTVRAGTSTGVVLRAVAAGNGVAVAHLHLQTRDARRLTDDVAVVVEATNLGTVGWAIVVVSGVVLVVSTALRIRTVRRQNREGGHG